MRYSEVEAEAEAEAEVEVEVEAEVEVEVVFRSDVAKGDRTSLSNPGP